MPVFISHRTADDALAGHVAHRLRSVHNITCYVDDIDQRLLSVSQQELTRLLVDAINGCTNLLAVMTVNTSGSWWVPFEIGVAKQAPRVISTMTNLRDSELPGYLLEWPRLRGDDAIDKFAELYKAQRRILSEQVLQKRASASSQASTVEAFHRSLKASLGQ